MTLQSGSLLGPYELQSPLGAGGMGEVWRARDRRLDRVVAVKVLPPAFAHEADRRARLDREARAISSLNHPNICALFDVGHQDGIDYLVMELLDGEPLDRRLQRGPLPLAQLLRVGIEIAGALAAAHRQGIVHRDLKPGNVMLTRTGAKLLDFGIAKALPSSAQPAVLTTPAGQPTHTPRPLTGVGVLVGTMHYIAPEQLEGREVDARADLFAFGAMLHEMATGRRAFDGQSQASLIASILEREPPPVSQLQPMTPPSLDRLVRLCLAKDPDARWQAAHDVELVLEAISEEAAPLFVQAAAQRRRTIERVAWIAAVALLLAAVGWLLARRPHAAAGSAGLRVALLPPAGVTSSGPLAIAPDGRSIAFAGYREDGVPHLFVRALSDLEARELPGSEDASLPFWSPDSRSLGFFAQRRMKRIELAGGPPRDLAEVTDSRGGTWGKDNVIVFSPNPGDGLYRIPAEGGQVQPLTHLDAGRAESSHRWPSFLADGTHVAFLVLSGERERLHLAVAASGNGHVERLAVADSTAVPAGGDRILFVRGETLLAQSIDGGDTRLRGEPQPLADGVWRDPDLDGLHAFSAAQDGTIAYRLGGGETTQLVWFDREGRPQGTLGAPGVGSVVSLSPDGRQVARSVTERGSSVAGLWLLDLDGQAASRFTFNRWNDIYPVWSPDGQRIVFTSDRSGSYNLYEKPVAGGEERPLLRGDLWDFPEDWSRDGKLLAFSRRDHATKGDVWVLSLPAGNASASDRTAAGAARPLIQTEADELQPRFSPDGRFIAYVSDESGRNEVYVQAMPPTGAKWQVSSGGGFQPQWRRDGGELYFLSPDLKLVAVPVTLASGAFRAGTPQALFTTRIRRSILKGSSPYLPSPDGKRFLIDSTIGPDLSSPVQLVIERP